MSQDREFETYIQGKSDLSKLYAGLPQVELPGHLDAAILAEAHRAVGARPGASRRRWVIPLSMVATLAVAVVIGLQLRYVLNGSPSLPEPQAEKPGVAAMDKKTAGAAAPALHKPEAQAFAKSPPEMSREQADVAQPAKKAAPGNAPGMGVLAESPAAPAESRARAAVAAPAAPEVSTTRRFAERQLNKPTESYAPVQAAEEAPPSLQAQSEAKESLKGAAGGVFMHPQEWLARIKLLKKQGKVEDAEKELAAFRKRYPDYPIPKVLEER